MERDGIEPSQHLGTNKGAPGSLTKPGRPLRFQALHEVLGDERESTGRTHFDAGGLVDLVAEVGKVSGYSFEQAALALVLTTSPLLRGSSFRSA